MGSHSSSVDFKTGNTGEHKQDKWILGTCTFKPEFKGTDNEIYCEDPPEEPADDEPADVDQLVEEPVDSMSYEICAPNGKQMMVFTPWGTTEPMAVQEHMCWYCPTKKDDDFCQEYCSCFDVSQLANDACNEKQKDDRCYFKYESDSKVETTANGHNTTSSWSKSWDSVCIESDAGLSCAPYTSYNSGFPLGTCKDPTTKYQTWLPEGSTCLNKYGRNSKSVSLYPTQQIYEHEADIFVLGTCTHVPENVGTDYEIQCKAPPDFIL